MANKCGDLGNFLVLLFLPPLPPSTLTFSQVSVLEKFAQRRPTCVAYDEKLHFYSSVAAEVATHSSSREMGVAVLHLDPLARALQENARSWVTSLGKLLNDSAKESLTKLNAELEVRRNTCIFILLMVGWYCLFDLIQYRLCIKMYVCMYVPFSIANHPCFILMS